MFIEEDDVTKKKKLQSSLSELHSFLATAKEERKLEARHKGDWGGREREREAISLLLRLINNTLMLQSKENRGGVWCHFHACRAQDGPAD